MIFLPARTVSFQAGNMRLFRKKAGLERLVCAIILICRQMYQLFGDELNDILDELNEALAA